MGKAEDYIEEALAAYELGAPVVGAVRFGEGHINDTFCVHTQPPDGACRRFILQRISAAAFGNPEQLMRNVVGVTDYLKKVIAREGGNPDRETLTILRTRTGTCYFTHHRYFKVQELDSDNRIFDQIFTDEFLFDQFGNLHTGQTFYMNFT